MTYNLLGLDYDIALLQNYHWACQMSNFLDFWSIFYEHVLYN